MNRLHGLPNDGGTQVAKGAPAFSAPQRAKYLLRDNARVLRSGSIDSVMRIPAAQVPHGAEIVNERESVKARWSESAGGFVFVTGD